MPPAELTYWRSTMHHPTDPPLRTRAERGLNLTIVLVGVLAFCVGGLLGYGLTLV